MSANFTEIERKFLVWPVPHEKLEPYPRRHFKQGYVVTGDTEVRVRSALSEATSENFMTDESDHYLAIKRGLGYVRDEVEVAICAAEAEKLFELCEGRVLTKTRYDLPNGYALDELHGELQGIWILEIEQEKESAIVPFMPDFITVMMDVTDRPAFKTQRLAERVAAA